MTMRNVERREMNTLARKYQIASLKVRKSICIHSLSAMIDKQIKKTKEHTRMEVRVPSSKLFPATFDRLDLGGGGLLVLASSGKRALLARVFMSFGTSCGRT